MACFLMTFVAVWSTLNIFDVADRVLPNLEDGESSSSAHLDLGAPEAAHATLLVLPNIIQSSSSWGTSTLNDLKEIETNSMNLEHSPKKFEPTGELSKAKLSSKPCDTNPQRSLRTTAQQSTFENFSMSWVTSALRNLEIDTSNIPRLNVMVPETVNLLEELGPLKLWRKRSDAKIDGHEIDQNREASFRCCVRGHSYGVSQRPPTGSRSTNCESKSEGALSNDSRERLTSRTLPLSHEVKQFTGRPLNPEVNEGKLEEIDLNEEGCSGLGRARSSAATLAKNGADYSSQMYPSSSSAIMDFRLPMEMLQSTSEDSESGRVGRSDTESSVALKSVTSKILRRSTRHIGDGIQLISETKSEKFSKFLSLSDCEVRHDHHWPSASADSEAFPELDSEISEKSVDQTGHFHWSDEEYQKKLLHYQSTRGCQRSWDWEALDTLVSRLQEESCSIVAERGFWEATHDPCHIDGTDGIDFGGNCDLTVRQMRTLMRTLMRRFIGRTFLKK